MKTIFLFFIAVFALSITSFSQTLSQTFSLLDITEVVFKSKMINYGISANLIPNSSDVYYWEDEYWNHYILLDKKTKLTYYIFGYPKTLQVLNEFRESIAAKSNFSKIGDTFWIGSENNKSYKIFQTRDKTNKSKIGWYFEIKN